MVATSVFKQRFVYVSEIMLILSVEQHEHSSVEHDDSAGSITEAVNFEEKTYIIRFDG